MTIYERHMAAGSWDLTLRDDTPDSVLDACAVPFSHVVVTAAWLDPTTISDAHILDGARYVGVMLRPPRQRIIGGVGLAWWLGDPDGDGDCLTTAVTLTGDTFQSAVGDAIPSSLTSGSVETAGGAMSGTYRWISRRDFLDAVCDFFGREWRINPDFTLDAGTVSHLFGGSEVCLLGPDAASSDLLIESIEGDVTPMVDWSGWRNAATVLGRGGTGSDTAAGGTYYDGLGTAVTRRSLVSSPDAPPGEEDVVAGTIVDELADESHTFAVSVTTSDRDPRASFDVGDQIWLYDPANGIVDTSNQVQYRGSTIFPLSTRVWACRWGVTQGMGVYVRVHDGSTVSYVDISRHVEYEQPGGQVEVGPRRLRPIGERLAQVAANRDRWLHTAWEAYTPAWTVTGAPSSIGNGTLIGSWRRVGTTLSVWGRLTFGSTTSAGTGGWFITVPGVAAVTGHISCQLLDSGTAYHTGQALHTASDNRLTFITSASSGVTNTAPFTWTTGDYLEWSGTLEVL